MSRRDGRGSRALPEDLDALGRALERAAGHQLARRRQLVRMAQAVAIVAIAVPCALAVWTPDLGSGGASAPPAALAPGTPTTTSTESQPTTHQDSAVIADDGDSSSSWTDPCLDGNACAAASAQSVFVTEDQR